MTNTTYNKLKSGNWGIRSTSALTAGMTVSVSKRDGTTKTETVETIVWSGNGVWIAAIRASAPSSSARRTGCSCGSREGITRDSDCWTCRHDAE